METMKDSGKRRVQTLKADIEMAEYWASLPNQIDRPGDGFGWRHVCLRLAKEAERNLPQPIETAPRDGEPILIFDGMFWVMAFWSNGCWYGDHHSSWLGSRLEYRTITHWMPMPPKPE